MKHRNNGLRRILPLAGLMLMLSLGGGALSASTDTGAWYPKTRTSDKGTIVLYTPQVRSWDDFKTLRAHMAFQVEAKDTGRTAYGSIDFTASTEVELTNREVLLFDMSINKLYIPGIQEYEVEYHVIREAVEGGSTQVPLDLVLAYLPDSLPIAKAANLNTEPPPIFVSTEPAALLIIDAKPVFLPAGESGMEFLLNANWSVFREAGGEELYLLGPDGWLTGASIEGPWVRSTSLPEAFRQLPDDPSWAEAKAALPEELSGFMVIQSLPPRVITTMEPAELIVFRGEPTWEPIGETGVDVAANSDSEIYRCDGSFYFLSAGRWFAASSLDGDWKLKSQLPEAFQEIPEDHAKAYIRSSIPGTQEAWEAALVASIPVSASFNKTDAAELAPEVKHVGEPVFLPIEGTSIEMAVSTSYQVLKYQDTYYLCYNATWFTSPNPEGPWSFAESLPDEFSKIPPSSPAHNTTYVKVEESDEGTVTYSSTAGYTNSYVSDSGTVVNGTGFVQSAVAIWAVSEIVEEVNYNSYPYPYPYPYYPYPYYPWPPTYGYGSWYNPQTGRYGESVVGYGPYGAARSTAIYNPETGVYGRGQAVWDSDEWAGRSYAYNPNTRTSTSRRGYYDFDDNEGWSQRVTRRGDEWIYRETEIEDGRLTSNIETSRGGEGTITRDRNGDEVTGSGSFETGGGRQIDSEFTREREGDMLVTNRDFQGENRSGQMTGIIEDGEGMFNMSGSEGGIGTVNRELEDGQLTGSGSFTRDGKTIEGETTRSAEGVRRELESSEGGQAVTGRQGDDRGFVGQTGSGDVYAGRNGEVYKKTDSGWQQMNNSTRAATTAEGAFGGGGRSSGAVSTGTYRQLDRDYQSRQRGYRNYDSFSQGRSGSYGGGANLRRRR